MERTFYSHAWHIRWQWAWSWKVGPVMADFAMLRGNWRAWLWIGSFHIGLTYQFSPGMESDLRAERPWDTREWKFAVRWTSRKDRV